MRKKRSKLCTTTFMFDVHYDSKRINLAKIGAALNRLVSTLEFGAADVDGLGVIAGETKTISLARCQDCTRVFAEENLEEIRHLDTRVHPGEPMPAGQCPACGALCQLIT